MFKNKLSIFLLLSFIISLTIGANCTFADSIPMNETIVNKSTTMKLKKMKVQTNEKGNAFANIHIEETNVKNSSPVTSSVQPSNIEWQHVLNYEGYDAAYSNNFQNTADGGYVIAATTGNSLIWLTKIDSNGTIEWSYAYGQGNSWSVKGVRQTSDNGYIITGKVNSDVFLVKIDANGTVEWLQLFGGDKHDEGNDVVQTIDGGYFIIGTSQSYGDGHYEALLIKTDDTGNIAWGTTLTSTTRHEFGQQALVETSTGNIIVRNHSTLLSNDRTTLLEISNTGTLSQSKIYDDLMDGSVSHMALTRDNGLVLTGRKSEYIDNKHVPKVSVAKLDSSFNKDWQKNYYVNGYDSYVDGEYVYQTNEGGFIITANISYYDESIKKTLNDIGLIKVTASGTTEWIQTYNIREYDYPFYVHQTSDSGYVFGGKTQSTDSDVFIIKLK